MPELPEVETMAADLGAVLPGRRVEAAWLARPELLLRDSRPFPENLPIGQTIGRVRRRAKTLLIEIGPTTVLALIPRMTGAPRIAGADEPRLKHDHFGLRVSGDPDSLELRWNDPRRFGRIAFWERLPDYARRPGDSNLRDAEGQDPFRHTGPEPLSAGRNVITTRLGAIHSRRAIKAVLLDQSVLAGIGNIYADEILFRAKVRPQRGLNTLSVAERIALGQATREILAAAILARGSRVRSYQAPAGGAAMQRQLAVYDRGGQLCDGCGQLLSKGRVAGRTTVWCESCQS